MATAQVGAAPEGWFHYLTTDLQVLGIVTWVGTAATIVGFGLALIQLQRVKRASDAAKDASATTASALRKREQSGRLNHALSQLRSARNYIGYNKVDAAAAYLEVSWSTLVELRALARNEGDLKALTGYLASLRRVLDDINPYDEQAEAELSAKGYLAEVQSALTGLEEMTARLHFKSDDAGD